MIALNIPRYNNVPTPDEAFNHMMGFSNQNIKNDIVHIPFENLVFFQDQHFSMYNDADAHAMAEDIKINGVLSPAIVRLIDGGLYEVLAGRNRTTCAKLAGLNDIPCIIKDVDDNHAKLIVNGTNINQRKSLLPSEKAFAYQGYELALKKIGGATSSRTTAAISEQTGESKKSIQRYIRLAELSPTLLDMVDRERIQVLAGVELTYLPQHVQEILAQYLEVNTEAKVTIGAAGKLREVGNYNNFGLSSIDTLLFPKRDLKPVAFKLNANNIKKHLPNSLQIDDYEKYIVDALEFYKNNQHGAT